ncbi:hypothetical protein GCM10010273_54200 [Streptomyces lavendulocolor]
MLPPHSGAIVDLNTVAPLCCPRTPRRAPRPRPAVRLRGYAPAGRAARAGPPQARPIARVRAISMTTRSGLGVGVRP